jgi:hypothetical protein
MVLCCPIVLKEETVRKSLSTLFWKGIDLAGRFLEFSGVMALYTGMYFGTSLYFCEIVMHEMQIAAFMQSLPIVVGRCIGKSPSICTTITRLPHAGTSQRNTCASDIPQKSIYICATCGDFDQSEWNNGCCCEATQF